MLPRDWPNLRRRSVGIDFYANNRRNLFVVEFYHRRVWATNTLNPGRKHCINGSLSESGLQFGRKNQVLHSIVYVLLNSLLQPVIGGQTQAYLLMAGRLFPNHVLDIRRKEVPQLALHSKPGKVDRRNWANQVIGHFIPSLAGAASSAGVGGIHEPPLKENILTS